MEKEPPLQEAQELLLVEQRETRWEEQIQILHVIPPKEEIEPQLHVEQMMRGQEWEEIRVPQRKEVEAHSQIRGQEDRLLLTEQVRRGLHNARHRLPAKLRPDSRVRQHALLLHLHADQSVEDLQEGPQEEVEQPVQAEEQDKMDKN